MAQGRGVTHGVLRPALFCDRDGVLIEEVGYLRDPAGVRLIPGVAALLAQVQKTGFAVVAVSNQAGVARGLMTVAEVDAVQARMLALFAAAGVTLDGAYYAPHHPEGVVPEFTADSEDRKPRPGMLIKAAKAHGLDLAKSWMVGDRVTDLEAGWNAGCAGTALVETGYGKTTREECAATGGRMPWTLVGATLATVGVEILQRMRAAARI